MSVDQHGRGIAPGLHPLAKHHRVLVGRQQLNFIHAELRQMGRQPLCCADDIVVMLILHRNRRDGNQLFQIGQEPFAILVCVFKRFLARITH